MPNTKPLVSVAIVCEHVLEEKDRVLSAIRLVDTYIVAPPAGLDLPPGATPAGINLRLLVALKSGDVTGTREVRLTLRPPTGETAEIHKGLFVFNGGEHGINLNVRFMMPTPEFGLYWFDVIVEGDVLTSIPLKLVLAPDATTQPSGS